MGFTYNYIGVALHLVLSSYAAVNFCFSVFHKCENTEFTQVKNVATCIPALLQEDFILLCGRVREAFLLFSSVFCLYRERERERGSVRGSVRGSERAREERRVGGVCIWCVVYVAMVPVRLSTLGVYIHMLKSHIRKSASIHVWLCTWHSP